MGTHPIFESDFDCLTERSRKMEDSDLSIGELLLLREQMGARQFDKERSEARKLKRGAAQDTSDVTVDKEDEVDVKAPKLVKHAPEEISSKRRPPKLRQVIPVAREKITDPRFKEDVTEFSQVAFDKRYSFISDMEKNERTVLQKKLRKVKNKELKGNIHKLINRIDQRAASRKERDEIRARETETKRVEREKQLLTGKKAFYHKKGSIAKEYRAEKTEQRIANYNDRQRAKMDAKKDKRSAQ